MIHIVIGLPGSGKTTYVNNIRKHNELVYDMDYISTALVLNNNECANSRTVSNMLLENVIRYFSYLDNDSYIIRCCPSIQDIDIFNKYDIDFIWIDGDIDSCMKRRENITLEKMIEYNDRIMNFVTKHECKIINCERW